MLIRSIGCVIAALALVGAPAMALSAGGQGAGKPAATSRGPVEEGAELYRAYCAACHGDKGKGDGPVASALRTTPTNLTRLTAANRGTFPAQRVAMVVEFGVMVPAHGTTDMPTWGNTFRAMGDETLVRQRVTALTRYLESIQSR
ncbi:MAG: cytochrome c [Acidobacteriota bacterium]|nr:cytochrome c [Acidobacteriota bacterium]